MVLRYPQTIPGLGGIYHTNTNSYQTIPITVNMRGLQPLKSQANDVAKFCRAIMSAAEL
ncbi:hypothetical protein DL95DRAFT_398830 [Leptodontidium sp. 2 PMI_412]|nr:hypothetical protein DL95DRAFT_398830 [Leptodontidium sp. 2 PMI_412]